MYAIIQNNIVTNVLRVDPYTIFAQGDAEQYTQINDTLGVGIGWLLTGTTYTAPPVASAVIPQSVTMRQARLALLAAGKLATVNSTIAAMTGGQGDSARIEWEFSSDVSRNQPLVLSIGVILGLTSTQMDALFVAASAL
jgi:hypothetical protein